MSLALLCVSSTIANQFVSVSSIVGHQNPFVFAKKVRLSAWLDGVNYMDGNDCTADHLAGCPS